MIIDSPIISGSYLSTGSLSQTGNVSITGSLTATAGISGSFSGSGADLFGIPASGITGLNLSQISSGSVSASISPSQGLLINTSVSASNFTGSFTGSLTGIATSASYASFALTSSYSLGGSGFPFSGSAVITGSLLVSGSAEITGSLSVSGSITASLFGTASQATSASYALTASYLLGYISPFPFTGSAAITGSLIVTGSVSISTLTTGSGVRYVIADQNGLLSAQTASAAIFTTQQVISTAGQTTFPITNGYATGYVTVFVNGTKLSADEYVDTSGTNIVFLTGSTAGDNVEFQKYLPAAGVSNNTLRSTNYFTATTGQTNFSVNYTPGLIDIFYNGAKLDNTEYTAANGTSITLATASAAGDRLEVDVYSYQVGAFSGIGGTGAANQLAYFNTSNSITGSNAFTVSGSAIIITGSLTVSGSGTFTNIGPAVFSGSVTAVGGFSGSFSGNADSASLAQNSLLLQGTGSIGFATTASLLAVSASQQQISASLLNVVANYATTGSNSFRADQSITGSLVVSSTITAQTLVVQTVTSSILYSSGSNVFGNQLANTQTFTGSVNITGSLALAGNVGIGTTDPFVIADKNLTVNGNSSAIQLGISGVRNAQFYADGAEVRLYAVTNVPLRFGTNDTEVMRITGSFVGIGTTTPKTVLDVYNNADVWHTMIGGGTSKLLIGGQATTGIVLQGAIAATPNNQAATSSYNIILQRDGGAVGIGSTTPTGSLDIYKNQNSSTIVKINNNNTGSLAHVNLQLGNFNSANGAGLALFGSGYTSNGLYFKDGLYIYNNRITGSIVVITEEANDIILATNRIERWKLSSTGAVVQKTGSYTIDSGVSGIAGILIAPEGTNSTSGFTNIQTFYGSVGYTAPLVLNRYGGNVGIGITQPSDRLVVSGAVSFIASIGVTSSPAAIYNSINGWFYIQGNSANGTLLYADQNRNTSVRVVSDGTIQFHNSGEKARFDSSGNLGIGTTTPAVSLHVNGLIYAAKGGSTNNIPGFQVRTGGGGPRIQTYGLDADQNAWMGLGTDMAGNPYEHSMYFSAPSSSPSLGRQTFGSYDGTTYTTKMTILRDGSIGAPTGTNIYNPSDVRLKQNVTTITDGLDKIMGLNPIKFNWVEGFSPDEQGKDMLGFIAQEVQNIVPEAVQGFSDGSALIVGETTIENPLRVNEKFIIPVLVKAIQELQEKLQRNNIN